MKKLKLLFLLAFLAMSVIVNGQTGYVVFVNQDSLIEAKLLAQPGVSDFAKRFGDTLMLKLDNGKYMIKVDYRGPAMFEDEHGNMVVDDYFKEDITIKYFFHGFVGNEKFFNISHTDDTPYPTTVAMSLSNYYLTINRSDGDSTELRNGDFSLDGSYFIEYDDSNSPNCEVRILYLNKTPFVHQTLWQFNAEKINFDKAIWVSNTDIKITRSNPYTGKPMSPLTYKFNGTKWVLATAQAAKPAVKKPVKK